jgi:hypothetical protein
VTAAGYSPNPTGERPAPEVLSDALPGLERALQRPAARRKAWPMPRPPKAAQGPPEPRERYGELVAAGVVPADLQPASLAAAYARTFGQPPSRLPGGGRGYRRSEVAVVLQVLGVRNR